MERLERPMEIAETSSNSNYEPSTTMIIDEHIMFSYYKGFDYLSDK